jgi:hypothetical protein
MVIFSSPGEVKAVTSLVPWRINVWKEGLEEGAQLRMLALKLALNEQHAGCRQR